MQPLATPARSPSLPTRGLVNVDVACGRCGYALRGLDAAGVCPECSGLIALSVQRSVLALAPRAFLDTVRSGLGLMFWGTIAYLLVTTLVAVVSTMVGVLGARAGAAAGAGGAVPAMPTTPVWVYALGGLAIIPCAVIVRGAWKFASHDAAIRTSIEKVSTRRLIRVSAAVLMVVLLVSAVVSPLAAIRTERAMGQFVQQMTAAQAAAAAAAAQAAAQPAQPGQPTVPADGTPAIEGDSSPTPAETDATGPVGTAAPAGQPVPPVPAPAAGGGGFGALAGLFGGMPLGLLVVTWGLSILIFVAWVLLFVSVLAYSRWLAEGIPNDDLAERCKHFRWVLPVVYVLGSCLVVGPYVATGLFCWVLWDLRRRLPIGVQASEAVRA